MVLDFLLKCGLIKIEKNKIQSGPVSIYLGSDSKLRKQYHTNWRLKAVEAMNFEKKNDIHYSSFISVSENDVPKIRELFLKAVEKARVVIKESKDEDCIYAYAIDLYELYKF